MHKPVSLFALVAAIIATAWWWLGAAVPMPSAPLAATDKLHCVSYAPFRGTQNPLDLSTRIEPWQIEEDLAFLSTVTDCVRTYSVDYGLENVPEIARRHGLAVMLGIWVSGHPDRTRTQIETGIALAKNNADVVRSVVVGNETLLRGEVTAEHLASLIASVRKQVPMPVTYADVWEFWLRNSELAAQTDFVTVHILPYWEDEPIPARHAAAHIASIRQRVVAAFPGQEVFIGEVGWPSAGRMRWGARPSPSNQARVMHQLLERGAAEGFRFNIIEAFDQPWKRILEGTVGAHWGLISDPPRQRKFAWGEPVSNHPHWPWQALGGIAFAACVFAVAVRTRRRRPDTPEPGTDVWLAVAAVAASAGVLLAWTAEEVLLDGFGVGGWVRGLSLFGIAAVAPLVGVAAIVAGVRTPSFAGVIGPAAGRTADPLQRALGWALIVLCVLAVQAALGLTFNPRYLDFPFAPLTAALVPFLLVASLMPRPDGARARAEAATAAVLAVCAAFIVWNETLANWQAVWFAGVLAVLVVILARARAEPG